MPSTPASGDHRGDPGRPAPPADPAGVRGQPKGDPPAEDRTGERDRDRDPHPRVQRPVSEQRQRDGDDVGERLPGRRAAEVERAVQRLIAPVQPAVGVIAGAGLGPMQQQTGHDDVGQRHQPARHGASQRRLSRGPPEDVEPPRGQGDIGRLQGGVGHEARRTVPAWRRASGASVSGAEASGGGAPGPPAAASRAAPRAGLGHAGRGARRPSPPGACAAGPPRRAARLAQPALGDQPLVDGAQAPLEHRVAPGCRAPPPHGSSSRRRRRRHRHRRSATGRRSPARGRCRPADRRQLRALLRRARQHDRLHGAPQALQDLAEEIVLEAVIQRHRRRRADDRDRPRRVQPELGQDRRIGLEVGEVVLLLEPRIAGAACPARRSGPAARAGSRRERRRPGRAGS